MAVRDWVSARGQAEQVLELALRRQEISQARLYAAMVNWAQSESGALILTDLVQTVLLRPCTTAFEQGEQHLVLKLLATAAQALEKAHVSEGEQLHVRFDQHDSPGTAIS